MAKPSRAVMMRWALGAGICLSTLERYLMGLPVSTASALAIVEAARRLGITLPHEPRVSTRGVSARTYIVPVERRR